MTVRLTFQKRSLRSASSRHGGCRILGRIGKSAHRGCRGRKRSTCRNVRSVWANNDTLWTLMVVIRRQCGAEADIWGWACDWGRKIRERVGCVARHERYSARRNPRYICMILTSCSVNSSSVDEIITAPRVKPTHIGPSIREHRDTAPHHPQLYSKHLVFLVGIASSTIAYDG